METPGHTGAVINAMLAVASGLCRHVLCFRTVWEATATELMRSGALRPPGGGRVDGDFQWRIPFGAASAVELDRACTRRSTCTASARRARCSAGSRSTPARNAARNPAAIYRDPLTIDDYLDARMITHAVRALRLRRAVRRRDGVRRLGGRRRCRPPRAVRVEAVGTQMTERLSWDQGTIDARAACVRAGGAPVEPHRPDPGRRRRRRDLRRVHLQLPSRGSRASGSARSARRPTSSPAARGSRSTASCRSTPTAGSCRPGAPTASASSTRGCVQLRGEGGERQVAGAEVAVVTTGGGLPGGALLLTRPR